MILMWPPLNRGDGRPSSASSCTGPGGRVPCCETVGLYVSVFFMEHGDSVTHPVLGQVAVHQTWICVDIQSVDGRRWCVDVRPC